MGAWDPAGPEREEMFFLPLGTGRAGQKPRDDQTKALGLVAPIGPHTWIFLPPPSPGDPVGLGAGQGLKARCSAKSVPTNEAEGGLLVPEGPPSDPRSCLSLGWRGGG